ncbi:lipase family protein [Acidimicrobiia bacterium EGI L10123]|uniref:esterase/lipase family protein n=1 Tax=Salinilacustrithrix flava TaxID=2957203 RepID=UPI003D7C3350|nr:lipase family protein [Acidimicrobiia bacterium EGI L10123]
MTRTRASVTLLLAAVMALVLAVPVGAAKGGNGGGNGGGKPTTTAPEETTTTASTTTAPEETTTTAPTTTAPAPDRDPILFVHGWNSSGSTWDTMVDRFLADGYAAEELMAFSYNTSQSNRTTAAEIADRVATLLTVNEADQVDIIAHSMGSLSSRHYVKFLGGMDGDVDTWVSLGGPNHGTDTAYFCWSTACTEMWPGSSFLDDLNAGDETPGSIVRYATWWSPCDSVINPDSSVPVSGGAVNTETACIGHSDLHQDATVYGQVAAFID